MKRSASMFAFSFTMIVAFISMAAETRKEAALHDLKNVDELKAVFNEDLGKPRLLVLLSPT